MKVISQSQKRKVRCPAFRRKRVELKRSFFISLNEATESRDSMKKVTSEFAKRGAACMQDYELSSVRFRLKAGLRTSFVPQHHHRINFGRSARGNPTRQQRNRRQQERHADKRQRICRADA